MKEFTTLRLRARANRDKAVADAYAAYEAALIQIATLEQSITLTKLTKQPRNVGRCIDSILPREHPFTTQDVRYSLEALDPGRIWNLRSIHDHLSTLRQRGIIKRLKRASATSHAIYIRADVDAEVSATGDDSLREVIGKVLNRPMTTIEIMQAVVHAGFRSELKPRRLCAYIGQVLRRGGWERDGAKWVAG